MLYFLKILLSKHYTLTILIVHMGYYSDYTPNHINVLSRLPPAIVEHQLHFNVTM